MNTIKKILLPIVACILISGCVSFQEPVPADYTGPIATISDSYTNHNTSTAHFFVLTKVDGNSVEDSGYRTRVANSGKGLNMTPEIISRDIFAKEQILTISGFVQFATDGQALFGDNMWVEKEIVLIPKENEAYTVEGELLEEGSKIWIKDTRGNISE